MILKAMAEPFRRWRPAVRLAWPWFLVSVLAMLAAVARREPQDAGIDAVLAGLAHWLCLLLFLTAWMRFLAGGAEIRLSRPVLLATGRVALVGAALYAAWQGGLLLLVLAIAAGHGLGLPDIAIDGLLLLALAGGWWLWARAAVYLAPLALDDADWRGGWAAGRAAGWRLMVALALAAAPMALATPLADGAAVLHAEAGRIALWPPLLWLLAGYLSAALFGAVLVAVWTVGRDGPPA
ncbi:MAG: hypothetical protein OHK0024_30650 [Thalassobaculales bacterium]